jgi:hypothetical protein
MVATDIDGGAGALMGNHSLRHVTLHLHLSFFIHYTLSRFGLKPVSTSIGDLPPNAGRGMVFIANSANSTFDRTTGMFTANSAHLQRIHPLQPSRDYLTAVRYAEL